MNILLEAALRFSQLGWSVLPVYGILEDGNCACQKGSGCKHPGKHPRTKRGYKDATTEEGEIRQFCQRPYTNLAVATGEKSKIVVLDVDAPHKGRESLAELEAKFGPLPETIRATSGMPGSEHLYFRAPLQSLSSRAGIYPGLDIRANGGMIVTPPSVHWSKTTYKWVEGCAPGMINLAEMPGWLVGLAQTKQTEGSASEETFFFTSGHRNDSLFRRACEFRNTGIPDTEILARIHEENVARCLPPLEKSEVEQIVRSSLSRPSNKGGTPNNWATPRPLPSLEIVIPPLPEEMIPTPLRPWVKDVAERMQVNLEMFMAAVIVSFSGLIGRRIGIKPKKFDDWTVIPNLWGGIVGPPSALKTPSIREALNPIYRLEHKAKAKYDEQLADHERRKKADKEFAAPPPIRKRYITSDVTTERLGMILQENPFGLIQFRDELYGFFKTMEKPGRESDRQLYLESFSGDVPYTWDRVMRGTVEIRALCLSILGGIQPDRLCAYFAETMKTGSSDDGFLARFQLLVFPNAQKTWQLVDRKPDYQARDRAFEIFEKIDTAEFALIGRAMGKYDNIPAVRFDELAQQIFYDWLTKLETRLRSGEIESRAFEAHLTKYRKLMPALALIFHLVDFFDGKVTDPNVSTSAASLAASWCDYLELHAHKIYEAATMPQLSAAHALAKRIEQGDLMDGMTVRDLYRRCWTSLRDKERVESGLSLLESHHWLRILDESKTGLGAPSQVIRLNPNLKKFQKGQE